MHSVDWSEVQGLYVVGELEAFQKLLFCPRIQSPETRTRRQEGSTRARKSATKLGNRQCQCGPTGHFRHTTTGNLRKYFEKCALVCKFTGNVGEVVFDFWQSLSQSMQSVSGTPLSSGWCGLIVLVPMLWRCDMSGAMPLPHRRARVWAAESLPLCQACET